MSVYQEQNPIRPAKLHVDVMRLSSKPCTGLLKNIRLDLQSNHFDVSITVCVNRMRLQIGLYQFGKEGIPQFNRQAVRIWEPRCP